MSRGDARLERCSRNSRVVNSVTVSRYQIVGKGVVIFIS
mgnify:CR=1 FL=1